MSSTAWLDSVNEWVATARERIDATVPIPLISDGTIKMFDALWEAFHWGDAGLRDAVENVLSRDPNDLASRFVALNTYYRLMTLSVPEKEEQVETARAQFRERLAYFVRSRLEIESNSANEIRWEIVNACTLEDFPLACSWCDLLARILPQPEVNYFQGRLHFLIALRAAWDGEDLRALEHFDLPIGPPSEDLWASLNAGFLYTAGCNAIRPKIAEEDRDQFRDVIKYLSKHLDDMRPSARFMIARSHSEVGEHHTAAQHYDWLLRNSANQVGRWKAEVGALEELLDAEDFIVPTLHRCLVDAYQKGGDTEKAITATERWIEAFPNHPGTYERIARLYQKQGDYRRAHDWLRKEVDRNPAFGEDPNVSIALALGSIAQPMNLEETTNKVVRGHEDELRRIRELLLEYWPSYWSFSKESQERWAAGTWLRQTSVPHLAGLASHSFVWVSERELRAGIFDTFREQLPRELLTKTHADKDKPFIKYLQRVGGLSLGQMLTVIGSIEGSRDPLIRAFGEWLKKERLWLLAEFRKIPAERINKLRNREDHADFREVTPTEAARMAKDCRQLLSLIYP